MDNQEKQDDSVQNNTTELNEESLGLLPSRLSDNFSQNSYDITVRTDNFGLIKSPRIVTLNEDWSGTIPFMRPNSSETTPRDSLGLLLDERESLGILNVSKLDDEFNNRNKLLRNDDLFENDDRNTSLLDTAFFFPNSPTIINNNNSPIRYQSVLNSNNLKIVEKENDQLLNGSQEVLQNNNVNLIDLNGSLINNDGINTIHYITTNKELKDNSELINNLSNISDKNFNDSVFIEAQHFASKFADGSILDQSFKDDDILDNTTEPPALFELSFENNLVVKNENIFKTVDKFLPPTSPNKEINEPKINKNIGQILDNLGLLFHCVSLDDDQKLVGLNLLNKLADLWKDKCNNSLENNYPDSGHESIDSGGGTTSVKESCKNKLIDKSSIKFEEKKANELKSTKGSNIIGNNTNLIRASINTNFNNKLQPKSAILNRKGPLKAIIPINEMAKLNKSAADKKLSSTPSRNEIPKKREVKLSTTPVNESKPIAQSTPGSSHIPTSKLLQLQIDNSISPLRRPSLINKNCSARTPSFSSKNYVMRNIYTKSNTKLNVTNLTKKSKNSFGKSSGIIGINSSNKKKTDNFSPFFALRHSLDNNRNILKEKNGLSSNGRNSLKRIGKENRQ